MEIEKINKTTKIDIKEGLKKIYPEVFEDNKINFEKLKELLNGEIIEKEDDRFYFNWAGKSSIYKLIQTPAYGTLKPDKEKSIDFDNTENIVIVGENLETLKLLLKPYFGKVKMIYIDPPYNTGKDFIYRDNFKEPVKDYLEKTGQIDSEGKKLTTNTEASGRYHSDWLNFMYPRLFLARSLLRDDGVIFISIDDNEVHHLRMIMDEIFGEENFVAEFPRSVGTVPKTTRGIQNRHDHILCYGKTKEISFGIDEEISEEHFKYDDNDGRGTYALIHPLDSGTIRYSKLLDYSIIFKGKTFEPGQHIKNKPAGKWLWRWSKDLVEWAISNNLIVEKNNRLYSKNYKNLKIMKVGNNYALIEKPVGKPFTSDTFMSEDFSNRTATREINKILGEGYYDYPKPTKLIKKMMEIIGEKNSIVMDFFAGSGTTGHAVWDLNKEDGGNRKFILVQLDEEVQDEEIKKDFPTVADICIERLRRVSEKYKKENSNLDLGFKVFKLDRSNFNLKDEFEFDPSEDKEELKKKYLEWLGVFVDQPLVSGWKKIDVIYEVMLKEGLNLNSKIEKVKIKEDEFYYVKDEGQNLDFYISFKDKFSQDTIEEIRTSKYKGKMFVFLDNALTDSDKINLSAFVRLKVI
jgi:adenine specific DNA methylase Mod